MAPALHGAALGLSLIVAIGAQNAFVLRQGLRGRYLLPVALTCTLVDASLIALGAGGLGSVIAANETLARVAAWGGAAFLLLYAARALRAALRPGVLEPGEGGAGSLRGALLATLAVSLLNPHVYLDTVVLLGSVAGQYDPAGRLRFALGAGAASAAWFFSLAYGAARLAPLFRRPLAWRLLDLAVAALMIAIAVGLLRGAT